MNEIAQSIKIQHRHMHSHTRWRTDKHVHLGTHELTMKICWSDLFHKIKTKNTEFIYIYI